MHGGKTPRGIALPQTTHGKHSVDLPTRYMAAYEGSREDPDQLNLADKIAATDTREQELRRRLTTGESGELWTRVLGIATALAEAHGDLVQALDAEEDPGEALATMERLLSRLDATTREAIADEQTWAAIFGVQDHRRKLAEAEGKRRVAMQELFSAEQGQLLIGVIVGSVKRHVRDRDVLAAISADLAGLVAQRGGGRAQPLSGDE